MKVFLCFCTAKKERDGLCHQRIKLKSGFEPDLSLQKKETFRIVPQQFLWLIVCYAE